MIKKILSLLVVGLLGISGVATTTASGMTNVETQTKVVTTGITLTDEQYNETINLMGATDVPEDKRLKVSGSDIDRYTGNGSTDESAVYSSAYLETKEDGYGVQVEILTPDTITEVTKETYQNAAVTAGANNIHIRIANVVVPVNGRGALAGIYKALETFGGADISQESIEYAELEIDTINNIITREEGNVDQEKVNELVSSLKLGTAEKIQANGGITEEEMQKLIDERLNEFKIEISEETKQELLSIILNFSKTDASKNKELLNTLGVLSGELLTQGANVFNKLDSNFDKGTANVSNQKGGSALPVKLIIAGVAGIALLSVLIIIITKVIGNKKVKHRPKSKKRRR